jgi:hypothetical protein
MNSKSLLTGFFSVCLLAIGLFQVQLPTLKKNQRGIASVDFSHDKIQIGSSIGSLAMKAGEFEAEVEYLNGKFFKSDYNHKILADLKREQFGKLQRNYLVTMDQLDQTKERIKKLKGVKKKEKKELSDELAKIEKKLKDLKIKELDEKLSKRIAEIKAEREAKIKAKLGQKQEENLENCQLQALIQLIRPKLNKENSQKLEELLKKMMEKRAEERLLAQVKMHDLLIPPMINYQRDHLEYQLQLEGPWDRGSIWSNPYQSEFQKYYGPQSHYNDSYASSLFHSPDYYNYRSSNGMSIPREGFNPRSFSFMDYGTPGFPFRAPSHAGNFSQRSAYYPQSINTPRNQAFTSYGGSIGGIATSYRIPGRSANMGMTRGLDPMGMHNVSRSHGHLMMSGQAYSGGFFSF